jgi:uncharacterized protein YciI
LSNNFGLSLDAQPAAFTWAVSFFDIDSIHDSGAAAGAENAALTYKGSMLCRRFLVWLALSLAATSAAQEATTLYYVVFLRPDPAGKPLTKDDAERIQAAHMANIHKMAEEGVLVAAGPFEDDAPAISGVFVLKARSIDEASRIAADDPTVREHRNTIDVHAWRGPAGIGDEYFRLHREHPETPENMGVQPIFLLRRGAAWNGSAPERVVALAQHQQYIDKLHRAGKLGAAGPVEADSDMLGLVVFHRIPLDEARQSIADDPAVKAGILRVEAHRWWCSDHVLPW